MMGWGFGEASSAYPAKIDPSTTPFPQALMIYRGYYMVARRYEFYFRVVKTIFYERVHRVSKILFFTARKYKFISSSHSVTFFLLYRQEDFCTNNDVEAGNDVIDILTSEDMENTPLKSWM